MKDYHINIFYSEEDGCYIADLPDFACCSAFGDTPEEALRELQIAKEGCLQVARENGYPIPEPRYKAPMPRIGRTRSSPIQVSSRGATKNGKPVRVLRTHKRKRAGAARA